jgi:hypothetical protein
MLKRGRSIYNKNVIEITLFQTIHNLTIIYNNYEKLIAEQIVEIQYLKDNQVIYLGAGGFVAEEGVEIVVNAVVKNEYMIYITLYGVPEDGIFDDKILEAIKSGELTVPET